MDISIVDMMVHVEETLPPERMHELEDAVRRDACVISACTSHSDPHLLMVTYNPDCTTSTSVLGTVQAEGVHAELVCL